MAEVVSIRGQDYATPNDCHCVADDLEQLASQIRSGEVAATRGVFVYERPDKVITHIALGDPITRLEAVGMMLWATEKIKHGFEE